MQYVRKWLNWLWNLDLTLQHAVIHVRKQKRRDVLTSTAAVIRDALSRSHSCHTAVWQEKNILYIHMHWQMLTKWSLSELCEYSLHNKTQKCSNTFPILMPKYKQCCLIFFFTYTHTRQYYSAHGSDDILSLARCAPWHSIDIFPLRTQDPGSINIGLRGVHLRWCWDGTIPISDFRHISPAD